MLRFAMIVGFILVGAGPTAAQVAAAPPAPTLKREATITSSLIRIGDLIDNAGAAATVPIFRAPDPGETGSVEAYRVVEAARPHGLVGIDTLGIGKVVVRRAGRVIGAKDIEAMIARALGNRYGLADPDNLMFTFDREAKPIHLEASASPDPQPTRIGYDRTLGRFDVSYEIASTDGLRATTLRYTGAVVETRPAAVLTRPLARGELVKDSDIAIERRSKAEIADDVAAVPAELVGLAARRPLRPGQMLRVADLMKPELVQRNEPVTIVYEMPGVFLTIRGKAADSGALGDVISVLNTQSKRTVQGTVTGPGRVTVATTAPRLAANAPTPVQQDPRAAAQRPTE